MIARKLMIAALVGACAASPLAIADTTSTTGKQSAGEYASDAVVTTKVKAALLKEQSTQSLSIKVKTENGVVNLSGTADNSTQIDSAIRVARGVEGVQDVRSDIQLKKTSSSK